MITSYVTSLAWKSARLVNTILYAGASSARSTASVAGVMPAPTHSSCLYTEYETWYSVAPVVQGTYFCTHAHVFLFAASA